MADQEQQTTTQDTGEIKGVYTISDIDKFNISKIESAKTGYLMELSLLDVQTAYEQLCDLISTMQIVIEKYFNEKEITDFKVKIDNKQYDFYQLKSEMEGEDDDKDLLRTVAESIFGIYNHFAKQIGVEIPTSRSWVKKKTHAENVLDSSKQRRNVL